MAAEEPLFDRSLKKRKKKVVAFTEDPLGPDADPTTPAPTTIENTTTNGDLVDLGPTTLHEQMKRSQDGASENVDAPDEVREDNDFKAMFPDGIKKKKKKKDIPMDFVSTYSILHQVVAILHCVCYQGDDASGASTPANAPTATEDLDFSDIKKKKKKSTKKAMEDFEKELNEAKAKDDADEGEPDDGEHLNDVDEADLGDDPFARNEAPAGIDSGTEPWLGSDRDYTYSEVRS